MSKPRQEAYCKQKLLEQGYEVYVPEMQRWERVQGQWQLRALVMFPRYVFFRPGKPGQSPSPAGSTPGVSHMVRFGYTLACMPEATLRSLQAAIAERAEALPTQPLGAGASVVFSDGPLKGAQGIVSSVAGERVRVMLSLLGREHRVVVWPQDLAAA